MSADVTEPQAAEPKATPETVITPKTPPRFDKLDMFWIALLGLSGFATFEGLASFISSGGVSFTWLSGFFCLIVVALLTGGMGITADYAFGAHKHESSVTGRWVTGLVYTFCALISLSLAFAWWWGMLGARDATNAQVDREIVIIDAGLNQTRRQLATARDQLSSLAKISGERASEESDRGGTCGTAGRGVGPAARLRVGNARLFNQISADTGARITRLDQSVSTTLGEVSRLRKEASNASSAVRAAKLGEVRVNLTALAEQVSGLAADPGLRAYAAEMGSLSRAFRTPDGHLGGGGTALTCLDAGVASALEGGQQALLGIKPAPLPAFTVYEGSEATEEAMRRFVATFIGWAARDTLGEGISSGKEFLALAFSLLVDGFLLWSTLRRGARNGCGDLRLKTKRAEQEIVRRQDGREAIELLAADEAVSHACAMIALADPDLPPFGEVLIEENGRNYLVIPAHASPEQSARALQTMLRIAGQLDAERGSGVNECIRFARRRFFYLCANRDKQARAALLRQGTGSTRWAQGSGYRWFWLTTDGLHRLTTWAQAHSTAPYALADGETVEAAHARAAKAKAQLHREVYSHKANQAEAKLAMQREQFATKLAATEAEVDRTSGDLHHHRTQTQNGSLWKRQPPRQDTTTI